MAVPPLGELLAIIPDSSEARGRIHPLTAVLSLAVVAMLASLKSLQAVEQEARTVDKGHGRHAELLQQSCSLPGSRGLPWAMIMPSLRKDYTTAVKNAIRRMDTSLVLT